MTKAPKREKHGRHKEDHKRRTLAARKQRIVRRSHSNHANTHQEVKRPGETRPQLPPAVSQFQGQRTGKVPFGKGDRVLLVGEGDFSFALSLAKHHPVSSILATSLDSEQVIYKKYPYARDIISQLQRPQRHLPDPLEKGDEDFRGFSPSSSSGDESVKGESTEDVPVSLHRTTKIQPKITLIHGVDATKLSSIHRKSLNRHAPFTKIVFNFPHVGGLSTDVNRQTRANQKLIQEFFASARVFLSSPENPVRPELKSNTSKVRYDTDEEYDSDDNIPKAGVAPGQILVTLFEGESYAEWNIKDIARDQGLRVVESFRFPWEAYPSYRHARTIGEIQTGKDRSSEGSRKGAWRGEDRPARCFVFEDKAGQMRGRIEKKRKRDLGSDSEDGLSE